MCSPSFTRSLSLDRVVVRTAERCQVLEPIHGATLDTPASLCADHRYGRRLRLSGSSLGYFLFALLRTLAVFFNACATPVVEGGLAMNFS
jgi:hypothetical protein